MTILRTRGGVGNYYEVVLPFLGDDFIACPVGAAIHGQGAHRRIVPAFADAVRFTRALMASRADTVLVNPSLDFRSLIRDGVSIVIGKAFGSRTVVFYRGWDTPTEMRLRGWRRSLYQKVFFRTDASIVLCSEFRVKLRDWGYKRPVHVLTTVASDGCFEAGAERLSRPAGAGDGAVRILFMGWLARDKGILETIEAFSLARARVGTLELVVAGRGPVAENARLLASRLGLAETIFVGHMSGEAKSAALAAADIFVLPSTHGEGMPNAVLEALAAGLTVIASPVGGLRDFLFRRHLGIELTDVAPEPLAEALVRAAEDEALRGRLAADGRSFAERHFTPETTARRLRAIVDALRDRVDWASDQTDYTWYEDEPVSRTDVTTHDED